MNRALRRQQKRDQKKKLRNILAQGTVMEKLQHGAALQKKNKIEQAVKYYDAALQEDPNNTDALYLKGGALIQLLRYDEARPLLEKCLSLKEDIAAAHHNLGYINHLEGNFDDAVTHLSRALELGTTNNNTRHYLKLARERNNDVTSAEYTKLLYDGAAEIFEYNLVDSLKYDAPKRMRKRLEKHLPGRMKNALDLGCGTGLMGVELSGHVERLTGEDISGNMIKKAEEKKVYEKLVAQPMEEFLQDTDETYDLVTAMDVFIYIGEIDNIFGLIKARMEEGGLFAFTTEKLEDDAPEDLKVDDNSSRYKHKNSYLKALAEKHGFTEVLFEEDFLRYENKSPLTAAYVILRK